MFSPGTWLRSGCWKDETKGGWYTQRVSEELGLSRSPVPHLGHLPDAILCLQQNSPHRPHISDGLVLLGLWCGLSAGVRTPGEAWGFPSPHWLGGGPLQGVCTSWQ